MKKLSEIIVKLEIKDSIGDLEKTVSAICYDSRKAVLGSVFVAIQGANSDGNSYIDSAINNGAGVIIAEKTPNNILQNITYIIVENARKALAVISNNFYSNPSGKLNIIGITGTNGKTTTTYLIKTIFDSASLKSGIIGTTGIYIGSELLPATHTTPESLELQKIFNQMNDSNVEYVAMEVSSHALCQYRVFGANFKTAVFSNLTRDHLDYHNTMEEYALAKRKLFESLSEDSIALANGDSEYGEFMLSVAKSKIKRTIGRNPNSDITINNIKLSLAGAEFDLFFKKENENIRIKTKLIGEFNVENAAISAAVAKLNGIDNERIISALANTNGAPGRMERFDLANGAIAFVDYAHTPDALEKALLACKKTIHNHSVNSKLISIFGCGGDRDGGKRPIMGEISERLADTSIITNDNPRTEDPNIIINEICAGLRNNESAIIIPDRAKAIKYACEIAKSGDIILVAGKGHEDYQIIGKEKLFFSDARELEKYQAL